MPEEIVVREVLIKQAKPGAVHYLGGIIAGALINVLLSFLCVPCLIPDLIGGSATVFIAKMLSGQKGRVSFGAAALTSGISGLVAAVALIAVTFVIGVGLSGFMGALFGLGAKDALMGSLFGGIFGAVFGAVTSGIYAIFLLVIDGVLKTVFSAIGGVLTSQLDST